MLDDTRASSSKLKRIIRKLFCDCGIHICHMLWCILIRLTFCAGLCDFFADLWTELIIRAADCNTDCTVFYETLTYTDTWSRLFTSSGICHRKHFRNIDGIPENTCNRTLCRIDCKARLSKWKLNVLSCCKHIFYIFKVNTLLLFYFFHRKIFLCSLK